jgi:signal transduction histidine kinase/sugar lactone lactonase YvrE
MKGMFLGVRVYKLKKPILLGTNIVALLAFCLVTGIILASGGVKVKKPEVAKAEAAILETLPVENLSGSLFSLRGKLTYEDKPVTERGFEWGTSTSYGNNLIYPNQLPPYIFQQKKAMPNPGGGGTANPASIAIDSTGKTYVAIPYQHIIEIFGNDGAFLGYIGNPGIEGSGDYEFKYPYGIAIDSSDNLYVADTYNNKIKVFNSEGVFQYKFGDYGTSPGMLNLPFGIDITSDGKVYIANTGNDNIEIFEQAGINIGTIGTNTPVGNISDPQAVKIRSDGTIFISDTGNSRILIYNDDYSYNSYIGSYIQSATSSSFVNLGFPRSLAFDSSNNLYISNPGYGLSSSRDTVVAVNTDGFLIGYFGSPGGDDGQFSLPWGLAFKNSGEIIAADYNGERIQTFNNSVYSSNIDLYQDPCNTTYHYRAYVIDSEGKKYGQDQSFQPCSVEINTEEATDIGPNYVTFNGNIISSNSQVVTRGFEYENVDTGGTGQVTSAIYNNEYLGQYNYFVKGFNTVNLNCNTNYRYRAFAILSDSYSPGYGEYQTFKTSSCPYSNTEDPIEIDYNSATLRGVQVSPNSEVYSRGFIYGNELKPFDPSLPDLSGLNVISDRSKKTKYFGGSFGSYGTEGRGKFNDPRGITVIGSLHFVLDSGNSLVQVFDKDNNFINQWGSFGEGDTEFNFPQAITSDGSNYIYILDSGNKRIKIYNTGGNLIKIIDTKGTENELSNPQGISFQGDKIYVSDTDNDRVIIFNGYDGTVFNKFGEAGSALGKFNNPIGIAATENLIYVVDSGNNRVEIFDKDGKFISSFGSNGNGNGQFNYPTQIYVADGLNTGEGSLAIGLVTIAVSDTGNNRIETFITAFSPAAGQLPIFQSAIGQSGDGEGQFNTPLGIYIDPTNTDIPSLNTNIYVADSGNNRIETITDGQYQDGDFQTRLTGLSCGTNYQYTSFILSTAGESEFPFQSESNIKSFTTLPCEMNITTNQSSNTSSVSSTLSGSINYPGGFIDKRGFQWGTDTNYGNTTQDSDTNREDAQKYVRNINTIPSIQINGDNLYIEGVANIALANDSEENLYVSNIHLVGNADEIQQLEGRITKYNSNGALVSNIIVYPDIQTQGFAGGITIDAGNNIYATNPLKGTIQKFSAEGVLINEFAVADPVTDIEVQQPYPPIDLALDSSNNIYITDPTGNSIRKYTNAGTLIWEIKNPGIIEGQNSLPVGIEIDEYNNVYVVDTLVRKITKYDSNGNYLLEFGGLGLDPGKFLLPLSIGADKRNGIYVNDLYKRNIQVFDESGRFKTQFTNNEGGIPLTSGYPIIDLFTIYFSGFINIPTSLNSTNTDTYVASPILGIKDYRRFFPVGSFSTNVTGLKCGTTYHYRSFGINQATTYYGEDKTFTTALCGGGNGGGGGSTTPLSEAPPTTTGAGFVPGTNMPKNTPGSSNPIANALRSLPRGVAAALPYILLAFLIVLAVLYAIQSYREFQSTKRLNALINKYQALQYGGKNFVTLTSHYLNTPIGIMQFSSELLVSLGLLTAAGASKVSSSIKNIKDSVLDLLKKNSETTEQIMQDVDKRLVDSKVRNAALQPAVWVPLLVATVLLIVTNIIFIYARLFSLSLGSLAVQITLFVLCTTLLILAFRSLARNRYIRKQRQALIDAEQKLMDTKKEFIDKTIQALESDIKELKAISASFKSKKQAEPFMRGLAMIVSVEGSFALLNKFAGYQPMGSTNSNDVNGVLNNIIARNDKAIKDKGLNIAQNIDDDLQLGLDKDALIVLLSSTIGNAIKFSKNDGSVEINIKKRINDVIITIQDNGLGIAKDKLDTLMMPFTRATDVMKYDYEGIGLGLYMDRIILEQIDGSIKLASAPGNGTTVRMKIPNKGLAETSPITNTANSPLSPNPEVRPA